MKLSMWMIANRLYSLDPILNIRQDAKPILKSARRAYATNCVLISQEGRDVICDGEDDTIRLKDISVSEASEIVQSVFDSYDDWYSNIIHLIASRNYQEAIDQSWVFFQNPIILFNGNSRTLGMSSRYGIGEVDEEWDFLLKYRFPSMNFLNFIKFQAAGSIFDYDGMKRLDFVSKKYRQGITYGLYYDDLFCGRITLLEKERPLNPGDYQLIDIFAGILKMQPLSLDEVSSCRQNMNIYPLLLRGKHVDHEQLKETLLFREWEIKDQYQLYLLSFESYDREQVTILSHMFTQQLSKCEVIHLEQNLVILCNTSKSNDCPDPILKDLSKPNHFVFSASLPVFDINRLHFLMDQASYALKAGTQRTVKEIFHPFYTYAIDYILESARPEYKLYACHPDVVKLWNLQENSNDYLFETLKAYIENERSLIGTAQTLFVHRNSVVYRIKKLENKLQCDLNRAYTREYISLSIRILELSNRIS